VIGLRIYQTVSEDMFVSFFTIVLVTTLKAVCFFFGAGGNALSVLKYFAVCVCVKLFSVHSLKHGHLKI